MDEVIFIEILDKSGRVNARSRHDHFPVTIGSAYTNDVILEDEFASPEHVAIEQNSDRALVINDLDSTNGIYTSTSVERKTRIVVAADNLVRVGHTTLRIRTAAFLPPAAIPENVKASVLLKTISGRWSLFLLLPLTLGIAIWSVFWETYTQIRIPALLLPPMLVMAMILIWSGIWALASRLYSHHSFYPRHIVISCLVFLASAILEILCGYYAFAFGAELSAEIVTYAGFTALTACLIYWHLRTCMQSMSKTLPIASGFIACTIAAIVWLSLHAASSNDNARLQYNAALKPLPFKLVDSATVADFAKSMAKIKTSADSAAHDSGR